MSKIFISYRRDDSADATGRCYDRLAAHFSADAVFIDIDKIHGGQNFRRVLERAVNECGVLLAVIGPGWLMARDGNGRRLESPNDFVRMEIETALRRGITVIPLLVTHARMPSEGDLPKSLGPLVYQQALKVRPDNDFDHDIHRLIQTVERIIGPPRATKKPGQTISDPSDAMKNCPKCGGLVLRRWVGLKSVWEHLTMASLLPFFGIPALLFYFIFRRPIFECRDCGKWLETSDFKQVVTNDRLLRRVCMFAVLLMYIVLFYIIGRNK